MQKQKGHIEVCFIEETFICGIYGDFTLEDIDKIQSDLQNGMYDFDKYKGLDIVKFVVDVVSEELQHGTGYGDVYKIPNYFDLTYLEGR